MTPANGIDKIAPPAIAKRARLSWASESASIALTFGRSAAQLPIPKPLAKKIAEVPRRARHGNANSIEMCVFCFFSGGIADRLHYFGVALCVHYCLAIGRR